MFLSPRHYSVIFLCLLASLIAGCSPDPDSNPVATDIDRMYSLSPAEAMRYGRAYAVDTLLFAALPAETAQDLAIQATVAGGFFEFSRGQTPDSLQAEQRGFLFGAAGFRPFPGIRSGMVPAPTGHDIRRFGHSPDLSIKGDPATGFFIRHAGSGFELVAPPLRELRAFRRGEVQASVYSGTARLKAGPADPARTVQILFERLYLPAANPFDEDAARLWGQRARAWLLLPGAGGQLLLAREAAPALAPLYSSGPDGERANADFALLIRGDAAFAAEFGFDPPLEETLQSNAVRDTARGSFRLPGNSEASSDGADACALELGLTQRHALRSISRADSTLALVADGQLRCSRRSYPVFGLLRSWPAAKP